MPEPLTSFPNRARFIQDVVAAQTRLMQAFQEQPMPEWLKMDLTLGQLRALFMLFQAGPTPIGQLGARLSLGRPAASLLVDALVRRGMVERFEDPADRRRTLARLSAEAQRLITEHYVGGAHQYEMWLSQLADDDLAHLSRSLRALAEIASPAIESAAV